jgi:hypothetical protein
MSHLKSLVLGCLALLVLSLAFSNYANALSKQSEWRMFMSETRLFNVLMPGKPDEHIVKFRAGDDALLLKSEAFAFIDQRPYKEVIKNYVVKFEQTIGLGISEKNRIDIVNKELNLYARTYSDRNARIVEQKITDDTYTTFGHLALYFDDETGPQGFRLRIVLTGTTKFYQIFSGPEKDMFSRVTNRYFESFKVRSGVLNQEGNINDDWKRIESPMGLFAIKAPDIAPPYFNNEPSVYEEERMERIGMIFTDPIWKQNIYYNVTGFQLEEEMSFELAEDVILEKFLEKHGRNMVGIKLEKNFIGDTPYVETSYAIKPPKGIPYLNQVRLRGMFLGNYMIVQEVVGPRHLLETGLIESFFNLVEFTPKKAFQNEIQRHMKKLQNKTTQQSQ